MNIHENVLRSMDRPGSNHRDPWFPPFFAQCLEDVKYIFNTQEGSSIIYPGTGTGGWEASLQNTLSPGDKVVTFRYGQFSHLWIDQMQASARGAPPPARPAALLHAVRTGMQAALDLPTRQLAAAAVFCLGVHARGKAAPPATSQGQTATAGVPCWGMLARAGAPRPAKFLAQSLCAEPHARAAAARPGRGGR